ncbi:MAG: single-stranded DNA-binding protein [Chloroflexota bacterium]|nr:single-stranded DNA-binding protein [Chloroflexota bacterium]
MNKVLLSGRLTRDPETRKLATGKTVTQFSVATNDYRGGTEKSEFHNIVTWDRLAEICGQYLGKGQLVNVEGRIQTRQWEDDNRLRHWKTEIVANAVEMLSGRRKRDYAAEAAAEALAAQAQALGVAPELDDSQTNEPEVEEAVAQQAEVSASENEEELVAA